MYELFLICLFTILNHLNKDPSFTMPPAGFSIHNVIIHHEKQKDISRATNVQLMWKYFWICVVAMLVHRISLPEAKCYHSHSKHENLSATAYFLYQNYITKGIILELYMWQILFNYENHSNCEIICVVISQQKLSGIPIRMYYTGDKNTHYRGGSTNNTAVTELDSYSDSVLVGKVCLKMQIN